MKKTREEGRLGKAVRKEGGKEGKEEKREGDREEGRKGRQMVF